MSIDRVHCYVVTCDRCRTKFNETDDQIIHFETPDEAILYIARDGWTLTENGEPRCRRCTGRAICDRDGHDYGPWHPCYCNGQIPEHAIHGCGMFRYCDECNHHETATLATLPTIEEPHTFGR